VCVAVCVSPRVSPQVSEDEDPAAGGDPGNDEFEEQTANLNTQYHQKVTANVLCIEYIPRK
jgi:hypothetical protein